MLTIRGRWITVPDRVPDVVHPVGRDRKPDTYYAERGLPVHFHMLCMYDVSSSNQNTGSALNTDESNSLIDTYGTLPYYDILTF